ncbi:Cytochrome c-type protein NapC, partial [hydrothermal vent metagenome]
MSISSKKFSLMSRKVMFGTTLGASLFFMIVGVIFWGGFNTSMEVTNTLKFCISCHEMEENVYQEYKKTIHYNNRSGVRATCSDCHVPRPWIHKVIRKVQATNEVFHKLLGSIDTPEKFDAKRLKMAKNVWHAMKDTDSRECRNCHNFDSMAPESQKKRSRKQHAKAMIDGNTCIDCHKGIAHTKVHDQLSEDELDELNKPLAENKREIAPQWQAFIDNGYKLVKKKDTAATKVVSPPEKVVAAQPAEASTPVAKPTGSSPASNINWGSIEAVDIPLFFPGQSSMEWVLKGSDHGGKRAIMTGDRCFDCHEDEEVDIGEKIVSGEILEPTPIPGKRGSIILKVQAAHDANNLYMRFQWKDDKHAPAPFVSGGKMDPENQIKFAIMLTTDSEDDPAVEFAERMGCWQSCHHDVNSMPHEPDKSLLKTSSLGKQLNLSGGFTKYLKESRTTIEIEGKNNKKRGGWDKLKSEVEIEALLKKGAFMDLLRYKSGTGESEDGYILAERVMTGGQGVSFAGELKDGVWTVVMKRKLTSDKLGD